MKSKNKAPQFIAAAIAAFVTGGALQGCKSSHHDNTAIEKHACKGLNSCKGQGGCGVPGKNACKGMNECKGLGGCNTEKNSCSGKDGCKGKTSCKGR